MPTKHTYLLFLCVIFSFIIMIKSILNKKPPAIITNSTAIILSIIGFILFLCFYLFCVFKIKNKS